MGVVIDRSRNELLEPFSVDRLREGYFSATDTDAQDRFAFVSEKFASNPKHAQRLYDYSSKLWLSYATPILAYGRNNKGLPISCFLSFLGDSMESILETSNETRMLSVVGGGVGLHIGLRPGDNKSSGIIPHLKTYDVDTLAFKQGTTRRGATAAYLPINHPEIQEFLEMRKPTGGDPNRKCLNLHHGVSITDDFMKRIEQLSTNKDLTDSEKETLDKYPLVNPHNGKIEKFVSARQLWQQLLDVRLQTGEPYLWFVDTVNEHLPVAQRNLGLTNKGSNLCSEISLTTGKDHLGRNRTAVCCLSSLNLEKYEEWKDDPHFIEDVVEMLDNVINVFIDEAQRYPEIKNAVYSAMRERSIGIGALGWHYLLQSKGIAIDSPMAVGLNKQIWSMLSSRAKAKTMKLAKERGACPDSIDGGMGDVRNMHLFAIAPNASSSQILGTSPSIEPVRANIYTEKGITGSVTKKNKYLVALLQKYDMDTPEVWSSILAHEGSVQHLKDRIQEYELLPFKTAIEVDQAWLVQHAIDRQPYICQAQSLNLFFPSDVEISYLHAVHLLAWQGGLKSLYYCRSVSANKAKIGKIERIRIEEIVQNNANAAEEVSCLACEG